MKDRIEKDASIVACSTRPDPLRPIDTTFHLVRDQSPTLDRELRGCLVLLLLQPRFQKSRLKSP